MGSLTDTQGASPGGEGQSPAAGPPRHGWAAHPGVSHLPCWTERPRCVRCDTDGTCPRPQATRGAQPVGGVTASKVAWQRPPHGVPCSCARGQAGKGWPSVPGPVGLWPRQACGSAVQRSGARHWLPRCQAEEEEQRAGGRAPRWVACTLHLGPQPHARAPGRRQAGGCPGLPASRWDGVGAPATSLTLVPVPRSAAWRGFCLPGWWRTVSLSEAGGWEGGARKPVLGAGPGWRVAPRPRALEFGAASAQAVGRGGRGSQRRLSGRAGSPTLPSPDPPPPRLASRGGQRGHSTDRWPAELGGGLSGAFSLLVSPCDSWRRGWAQRV